MFLIYDTETTGLPKNFNAPIADSDNWPRMVQIAWQLHNEKGELVSNKSYIIKPEGFDIPFNAVKIHGITTEKAQKEGLPLEDVLKEFLTAVKDAKILGGHNLTFDQNIVGAELYRKGMDPEKIELPVADTMKSSTDYCALPGGRGGGFKPPKLEELHKVLFGKKFDEAHNAAADVNATARCFMEMIRLKIFSRKEVGLPLEDYNDFSNLYTKPIAPFDIKIEAQVESFKKSGQGGEVEIDESQKATTDSPYFHFHNHTSYSVLSATTAIPNLIKSALDDKMPAVGMTDAGNLMGAFKFLAAVKKANESLEKPLMPIVGCEVYVAEDYKRKKFTKDNRDRRFTQLLLAKNKNGFHNLSRISSVGYLEGLYAGFPRVGKEIIENYKEDLIAITGSLGGEIPNLILNVGETQAEEAFQWWHNLFGEDFYVELIRHGLPEEEHVNQTMLKFAEKYGVKVLAQNNTYYIEQKDAEAHDILLCVRDGEKKETPIGRGRGMRFGFPNDEFYFKSQKQMRSLFHDIPEAIDNLSDFLQKFEAYDLARDVLLPKFDIPAEFVNPEDEKDNGTRGEMAYLRHLAYEGAEKRYNEITPEIRERLEFELNTIENTGYPGYFLIVQDFTSSAREMGVSVGPGRGSAAGSAVAYCIGITNVDPIKYDLLFERFLNPDRVSLPDIDIDFDDRGRDKIIQWVTDKYGKNQVSQIITYGKMAGKSAIRDTGRVLDLPLPDTDRIAKKTHLKLNKLFNMKPADLQKSLRPEEYNDSMDLLKLHDADSLEGRTLRQAQIIEGSLRNTGVHACGVIITPKDLRDLVPVAVAKDSDSLITQFDNSVVESAGLLKMDFLGLRTLTIINDTIELIEKNHKIKIHTDEIPLDDKKTYELFHRGETVGIFQYESVGMQKYLKELQPDEFEDLIAMNALYRPGPIKYIPDFIKRKHGQAPVTYDLPDMEEYLAETYGITVYQEQVMQLSRKLAGFTRGEADQLRKAMGKKIEALLKELKPKFLEGGKANGHPEKILEKIWKDWEAFASYAFNKSHSTCYALIAYHTAYLKTHYPAEFMAANLSNNMNNIKQVTFFMQECQAQGIPVLGPDVNESDYAFSVNKKGAIRFGMGAVKGVGSAAVEAIINEREENGRFESVFDFVERINLHQANKKTIENLALAGAFDEFEIHRAQFFYSEDGKTNNLENLIKYGASYQETKESSQQSLFAGMEDEIEIIKPKLPNCQPWENKQKANREEEVVGVYITCHPLDDLREAYEYYKSITLDQLYGNEERLVGRDIAVAGIIKEAKHLVSNKDNSEFGAFILKDYEGQYEFRIFGEDYLRFKHLLQNDMEVGVNLKVTINKYSGRVYVNITHMDLLSEAFKKVDKVFIEMNVNEITPDIYKLLLEILEKNEGDKRIIFVFRDKKENIKMGATKMKVKIDRELLKSFKNLPNMKYWLN